MTIPTGKFIGEKQENIKELALASGVPEALATALGANSKFSLDVTINGDNYVLKTDTTTFSFTPGVEFDDKQANGEVYKSVAKIEGGKITMTGKKADGSASGVRSFEFTGDSCVQVITISSSSVVAKRWYKKA